MNITIEEATVRWVEALEKASDESESIDGRLAWVRVVEGWAALAKELRTRAVEFRLAGMS